jgi:CheY-like chemotaxis protein
VSHELRTPLTPALFAASRLASWSGLPEQALKLATTIRRNIEIEARLIDDLLDLARINRDSLNLRLETVDVHDVIQEAVAICSGMAEPKGITITTHLNASAHHMSADRTRLRQVFWNLLNNAVKFTDDAGKITVGTADLSHGMLRASIHDTGIGMDAATIQHLFAPFDRQQPGNQSRGGLGLGLAICKGIIGAHRGQLWVASDGRGRGSTFAIEVATVPEPLPAEAARRLPRSTGDEPRSSAPRRVLVIEDDADSSEMLSMFLTQHGYEVEVADSLGAGVSRLMEGWDIVLSDIGLPDGSGLDVARRARQISPPPHRLIAFSGYGSTTDLRASREAGFDAHIVKPIDFDELLGALNGAGG